MSNGTVKWFDKGYGFIAGDDGKDAFVHWSNIAGTGFRNLVEGQRVSYDVEESEKGLQALNVFAIEETESVL